MTVEIQIRYSNYWWHYMLYITSESARCKTKIGYYVCWDEKNISLLGNSPDCSRLQSTFERSKNRHLPTKFWKKKYFQFFQAKKGCLVKIVMIIRNYHSDSLYQNFHTQAHLQSTGLQYRYPTYLITVYLQST